MTRAHACVGSQVSECALVVVHSTTPAPTMNGTLAPASVLASAVSPSLAPRTTK